MKSQSGLSLIELLMFMVIVAVGIVGVLSIFNTSVKHSADPMLRKQALLVAEAMLDEVLAKPFAVGGYSGSDRAQFDDVRDYQSFVMNGIKTLDGATVVGLENYNLEVAVNATTAVLGSITSSDVLAVTVTVTVAGEPLSLTGYRANYE